MAYGKPTNRTLCGIIDADEDTPGEFHKDIRTVKEALKGELERLYWGASLARSREQRMEFEAQPAKLFGAFER